MEGQRTHISDILTVYNIKALEEVDDRIMSPTLRHEAVYLCLLPLIPAHCPSHALQSEVPLKER